MKRRNFLTLSAGAAAGAALAACGSSGPSESTGTGSGAEAGYWFLSGPPGEPIRQGAVDRFNKANTGGQIKVTTFQNDAYKDKLKTALGAGQAPSIIWGWGGGGLKSYVDNDQVDDLTDWFGQNAAVKDRLFPASFGPATINGKIYAMPCETVQPIVLFYNKEVFDKLKLSPPTTWGEVMDIVPKINAANIAPFSLGGQSRWTNMMWLEFLFDRIGGPEVFQSVFDGQANAWNNPASLKGLTEIQNLIKANGFVKGFSSITADSNADQALLYRGKAAMMLHGSWSYGIISAEGGSFIKDGKLGYVNFPTVEGGTGDPSNTVGNAGQFLSIYSKASDAQKDTAKKFFTSLLDDTEQQGWIETGGVPIVKGADAKLAASPDKDFLNFIYQVSSSAKYFGQSWDQALSPTAAETLLDNIAKLFQLQIAPQQFADSMNQVIGK
ncbi:raffinose/stachyose/melibiose transport system substrate-binding protein [Actinoplanes lutulentus]|uniref:Carbohydrate ABC transporter substrate-binding protein (CUT1 family) n=1 Tax=Actinoplanes lutulentus TaxID=1287878 RepID=A0A327Z0R3_9ACTN|nr:extracellular solute-binding protein [Actinoplanes lutulentus]MBB2948641.1 raffinose/stachyose/melibiose transport system substrate-binding protein [Actinoplanes lutulentus]RAK27988.1 carbohydrate ABC transporter substrate-binding protein (CUT1 family) [Actinoplanes lutulentus]